MKRLYVQISAMFHYKEQILALDAGTENEYTEAAEEVLRGAIACHFDCLLDMYADEIQLHARESSTAEEDLMRLIHSYDIQDPADIAEAADMIRKLLGKYGT